MAVYIEWKGRDILIGNNSTIEIIREKIDLFILLNKIQLNKDLEELMLALDRAGSGFGFDLADYLHTKEDILTFIDLVRRAIDQYNQECKDGTQSTRDLIDKFYQELVKIEEPFPDNNILKFKKTIVDIIHIGITYLKRENDITLNEHLTRIMEDLNRAYSHSGLPLQEYLHTKEDITAFINLTKSAIGKYNQICQNAQQITRERFEGFYQELVKIAESFPE